MPEPAEQKQKAAEEGATSVRVAVRVRPQIAREQLDKCRKCTCVTAGEPQVVIGDRAFTYDRVFDCDTEQQMVYTDVVHDLVEGTFDGFNATVLAYGQTGSGKTYTMGTSFEATTASSEEVGIVPRALEHIFTGIERLKEHALQENRVQPVFTVSVQFIELYNDDIIDLLAETRSVGKGLRIQEDKGEIYLQGTTLISVNTVNQTLQVLKNGALSRTTASTNMNSQSSRSHAIFTVHIKQQRLTKFETESDEKDDGESPDSPDIGLEASMPEYEVLSAKFHFVDLAGSERLKRTGATGERQKEGININCGLLALGNVISALGDTTKKANHVPYRDSKLTRLLQDSLGGNSRTLMIACASPSDCDFVETLNTLKYANRAKNIQNRVVANQDKSSKLIGELRAEIRRLETEVNDYKQGRRVVVEDGGETFSDAYHENVMLQAEVNKLRMRVKSLQETVETIRTRNVQLLADRELQNIAGVGGKQNGMISTDDANNPLSLAVQRYMEEIETLRSSLCESQAQSEQLRRQLCHSNSNMHRQTSSMSFISEGDEPSMTSSMSASVIREAKNDIDRLKQSVEANLNNDGGEEESSDSDDGNDSAEDEDAAEHSENDGVKFRRDLADLQDEISIKERLVEELERSERQLQDVRRQYERQLNELATRITQTESERDRALAEIGTRGKEDSGKAENVKAEKVRSEYEQKLQEMRGRMRQLQMCEKEHKRMLTRQQQEQQRLAKLQNELADMKKLKVDLMRRIISFRKWHPSQD